MTEELMGEIERDFGFTEVSHRLETLVDSEKGNAGKYLTNVLTALAGVGIGVYDCVSKSEGNESLYLMAGIIGARAIFGAVNNVRDLTFGEEKLRIIDKYSVGIMAGIHSAYIAAFEILTGYGLTRLAGEIINCFDF
jgi:hypothetical protein